MDMLTLYPMTSDSFSRGFTCSQFSIILEFDVFHMTFEGGWLGAIKDTRFNKSITQTQTDFQNKGDNLRGFLVVTLTGWLGGPVPAVL